MTKVTVFPGPCGFEAVIEARTNGNYEAKMSIQSKCPAVRRMAEQLETLTLTDIVGQGGFGGVRPFQVASNTLSHATCPVLTGFLKAAEAELGLAVPRTVTIDFNSEE